MFIHKRLRDSNDSLFNRDEFERNLNNLLLILIINHNITNKLMYIKSQYLEINKNVVFILI